MKSLIESLSSPRLVAHIQKICGVQWKYPDENDAIHPQLQDYQENGRTVIKNKFIYYTMRLGSEMAAEPFYYTFLPVCSWMLDIGVARKTLAKLALIMYIGQSAKDILKVNRPSSPPVIRLEKTYETEYGMPSTHTVAGTVAPFALYAFSKQIFQIPERECLVAASVWTTWVAASRIYLGMHSVWQVLVGCLGAGAILYSSISLVNQMDLKLVESSLATTGMVASSMMLSCIIFHLDSGLDPETGKPRWNTARGDQAEIMGFSTGFLVGSRWSILQNLYEYRHLDRALIPIRKIDTKGTLIRLILGAVIVIPIVHIFRKISFHTFARIAGVHLRDKTQAKRHPKVELPYKYSTSFLAGVLMTSAVPWILNELNLWK